MHAAVPSSICSLRHSLYTFIMHAEQAFGFKTLLQASEQCSDLIMCMQEEEYKGLIVASSDWVAAITHTKISNSVYGTVLLSVFLAAVVVFVFCGRPLLTILATLTVVMANVAVMGLMYVWGWHLGAIEGMSITSLVGLSVDFCIHVAEGYMHGKAPDRKGKARYGSCTFQWAAACLKAVSVLLGVVLCVLQG
jgi:predicted RND superfamily exporter protein